MSEINTNLVEDGIEVTKPVIKRNKKMNHIVHLALFLAILGVICAGLLALVNELTAPAIQANLQKELEKTLEVINVKEPLPVEDVELIDGIEAIYSGKVDGAECYVFQTKVKNQYTTITSLIVIDKASKTILNVKTVGSGLTTHNLDSSIQASNFGVIGSNDSNFNSNFVPVANATTSSGSIKEGIRLAFEQMKGLEG